MTTLALESHESQNARWPKAGRHVLAQFDDNAVVVYQAYRPSIGLYAAEYQHFGGADFSLSRMSWIKPNFLWMMYRCGWAEKEGQEVVLAVSLKRAAFDDILAQAVPSSFVDRFYSSREAWETAVAASNVRLQWDPDHGPSGNPLERRAVQLGLRGPVLEKYAREWIVKVEDISAFVREQHASWKRDRTSLVTPREDVYPVTGKNQLGIDAWPTGTPVGDSSHST